MGGTLILTAIAGCTVVWQIVAWGHTGVWTPLPFSILCQEMELSWIYNPQGWYGVAKTMQWLLNWPIWGGIALIGVIICFISYLLDTLIDYCRKR